MNYKSAQVDQVEFRHGPSMRMQGWMDVKKGRFSLKKLRFAVLSGEAFSLHLNKGDPPIDEFNIADAVVFCSNWRHSRHFKLLAPSRVYICICGSFEEMQSWAKSLIYASKRSFNKYYNLLPMVGRGRFSTVYFACSLEDEHQVLAVKITRKDRQDPKLLQLGQRERYINSILRHPNIVRALDIFSNVEKDHMVFELMRGGNLRSLLRRHKRLPESYARAVMTQLNSALAYIHAKNVVHCDVRPANIFCSHTMFPMSIALGDFGSVNFSPETRVVQHFDVTIGVPPYISIDICRKIRYGPAADMWSAGVVLYEMLSGDSPFPGNSFEETISMIKEGKFTFYNEIWGTVSPEAKRLVLQLLQPDPFKRLSAIAVAEHPWILKTDGPVTTRDANEHRTGRQANLMRREDLDSFWSDKHAWNTSSAKTNSTPNIRLKGERISVDGSDDRTGRIQMSYPGPSFGNKHRNIQPLLPSVEAAAVEKGFRGVGWSSPSRFKALLDSPVVQMQLSSILPYRRKLVVVARAFVAVFRMKALAQGKCVTKLLPMMNTVEAKRIALTLDERRELGEKRRDRREHNEGQDQGLKSKC